ncbi:MAG: FAD-dependent oxidoreductase [Nitriliruptoraceae bacterium]
MVERLVIIGGDAAGMSAASQARRLRGGDDLSIVAFERGSTTSYAACGIPYWISGIVDDRDALVARTPQEFRERQSIDARIHHEVVAIDTQARVVEVRDLDGGTTRRESYDQLLIATGAEPVRPPIDGIDTAGVFGVQTLDDGAQVIDAVAKRDPHVAVVIGAGYIGLEMAESLCLAGLEVHLVEQSSQPMPTIEPGLAELLAAAMRRRGLHLHLERRVEGINAGTDGWVEAVVTGDERLPADLVVLGTGTRPNSRLAADAGIPIGPSGGIVVDRAQRTPVDGVWAAGDCAETFHRVSGQPVSIALGTIANRQGRIAGRNLGGEPASFPGVLGTAITKVCDLEVARTGLGTRDATAAGFAVVASTIESRTRAGYYPGAQPITITVIAQRDNGRLLGAQIVGQEGAAKRIDVFATAIWSSMTVFDLAESDLSYAPPFSPVWDPVLIAARKASDAVRAAA